MSLNTETIQGNYTSTGTFKVIRFPSDIDAFEMDNYTQYNSSANPGVLKHAKWYRGMPAASYLGVVNTAGAATDQRITATTGGFTLIESTPNNLAAPVTGTAITNANPAVVTATGHGYVTGDVVLVTGTTGMLQIAGLEFHVTRVDANNFQLTYLDASAYAAAATAVVCRKRITPALFQPKTCSILAITKANPAVVTLSTQHGLGVGETVKFNVPADFDMVEINGLTGTITAVTASTVSVDIDASGFTTFESPTSAQIPFTPAQLVPVGDVGVTTGAKINEGYRGLYIDATISGANNDVIYWKAFRAGQRITS